MKFQPGFLGLVAVLLIASLLGLRYQMPSPPPVPPTTVQPTTVATVSRPGSRTGETAATPPSPTKIHRLVNPAVVTVQSGSTIGSGLIVRNSGLVLTSKHLISQTEELTVQTAAGKTYRGYVVDADFQSDLALVQLLNADRLPTIRLASSLTLKPGDPVYAIGSPAGRSGTITQGTFERITEHGSLQTSPGLLQPGNSGGPLLNANGELIGVNKGVLTDNRGLATSVTAVQALLTRRAKFPPP
jgi:S1-C subfamily serine protease